MSYACIYIEQGTVVQSGITNTAWTKVQGYTDRGSFNAAKADSGSSEVQVAIDGDYFVFAQLSFSGSIQTQYEYAIFKNDENTELQTNRNIAGSAATGSVAVGGLLRLFAGDRLDFRVKADGSGKSITVKSAQLVVFKL